MVLVKDKEEEKDRVRVKVIETKKEIICSICGRKYIYERKKGHGKTKCNSCVVNIRRFNLKIKMIKYKGGKCAKCGYNNNIKALVFHHINPEEKIFAISGAHCRSWKVIKEELKKCILLCSNCHIEEHDNMIKK